jgi:hypothetical protein
MQEAAKYSIPSVFQDLKDDQVRGDIFGTLVHLDDVINDVFDHIGKRLKEEKDRVGSVNEVLLSRVHRLPPSAPPLLLPLNIMYCYSTSEDW